MFVNFNTSIKNVSFLKLQKVPHKVKKQISDTEKEIENKKKKIIFGLAALGIIGAAGATCAIIKGKKPKILSIDEFNKIGGYDEIDKGIAIVKGKRFTGTIKIQDDILLEYNNGRLEYIRK